MARSALLRSPAVIRFRFLGTALALSAIVGTLVHAQLTDEEKKKREARSKAREEMRAIASPTPSETPEPTAKPKPADRKSKAKKHSSPKPKATPTPTPKARKSPAAEPDESPSPKSKEKSGLETEQGFEPPPPPPPRSGFWPWSRKMVNYRYLTSATIDAIRRAPVQRARWKFIIVHNSGTRQGNARAFDYYHRRIRRMKNGLAYHFVIGNGTSSRNGQIEIGDRWVHQLRGGHVHSDYMNNIGLGICLVGDFNRDQPTRAQLEACEELIKYLQERCGAKMTVRPHREVNPPRWATDCPGDVFPYGWFGRFR